MKDKISALVSTHIHREGIGKLGSFLESSDFYRAPCSTKFHLAKPGGLAEHTYNVMMMAEQINQYHGSPCPTESVLLAALCHDFCKINFYKEIDEPATDAQIKYLRSLLIQNSFAMPTKMNKQYCSTLIDYLLKKHKPGQTLPPFTPCYVPEDSFPFGHGEKSAMVASKYIELTDEEALAIRWHMATFDASIHFPYPSGYAYNEALKKSKLVAILVLADFEASNLVEV